MNGWTSERKRGGRTEGRKERGKRMNERISDLKRRKWNKWGTEKMDGWMEIRWVSEIIKKRREKTGKIDGGNESLNEWQNKSRKKNKRTGAWMNGWTNSWLREQIKERVKQGTDDSMKGSMNEESKGWNKKHDTKHKSCTRSPEDPIPQGLHRRNAFPG